MTELFAGRFVDRNGVKKSFDLGLDLTDLSRLDQIQISPQVAGAIVSVLIEFLGDQALQVPFYAPSILAANREYRETTASIGETGTLLDKIRLAIKSNLVSVDDAEDLNIPLHGPVSWDLVGSSPMIGENLSRMLLRRVDELDGDLLRWGRRKKDLETLFKKIIKAEPADRSKLQNLFTCHKLGVISDHMKCRFVPDADHQGVCGDLSLDPPETRDTGRDKGKKVDYADLVGKIVAFSAVVAEKSIRSLFGGIIRGIWLLSLDNEVLAEVVSSAAASLAKKTVEKVMYEWLTEYIRDETVDPEDKRDFLNRLAKIHEFLIDED